ncbi:hypothetical protein THAOC_01753, partial [Thalassiosira oceanica]
KKSRLDFDHRGDKDNNGGVEDDRKPAANPAKVRPNKRPRDDEYDPVLVRQYAEKSRKDFAAAKEELGGGSRFGTRYQRDLNDMQRKALAMTRKRCREGIDILHDRNEMVDPSSGCWSLVNTRSTVVNMEDNNKASVVYIKGQPIKCVGVTAESGGVTAESGGVEESAETDVEGTETEDAEVEGVKVGHSTDASSRVSQYVEDIADKVRRKIGDRKSANVSDDDLELAVLINIDRLLVKSQKEVVAFLLDNLKALTFDKFPTTIGEAINHDRTGIPFSAQALIFSLINGVDDCNMVGGGIDVNGILSRFVMNALETGMTEWLRAKGVKINDLACLDELFHNNYMGLFVEILVEICEDLTKMFAKLSSAYPHDADKVAKLGIMIAEAVLSWPVDVERGN